MRRREELLLQGVNLDLSALSKFFRVWPCRRQMNDVDLRTPKVQNDVESYQAFNVTICKRFNRFLDTCKHQSAGFAEVSSTLLVLKRCIQLNVGGVPQGCVHWPPNNSGTQADVPKSGPLCSSEMGRICANDLIPCAPLSLPSFSLCCPFISKSLWELQEPLFGASNMASIARNSLLETQKLLLAIGIWSSGCGKWEAEGSAGAWLWGREG